MITWVLFLTLLTSTGDKTLVQISGLKDAQACAVMQKKFHLGLIVEDEKNRDAKIVYSECLIQKVV